LSRRFQYVLTPKHGSWLNIVATLFGKMARTFLRHFRVRFRPSDFRHSEYYLMKRCTSKAPDVQTYIAQVSARRRAAIEKLRGLCRQNLTGYEECIEYGMPGYKRNGVLEVSFASQKQYIVLYVLKKDVVDEFRSALSFASIGKGCIRFKKPDRIDFAVLERLLHRTAASKSAPC
jgi:uncharacterized protein YdhG (YjbR/CyaY superfamily)